jgi:hypothetical protein
MFHSTLHPDRAVYMRTTQHGSSGPYSSLQPALFPSLTATTHK